MATIVKVPSTKRTGGKPGYRVRVRIWGKPPQSKTFSNLKDAKHWGAAIETAIREGKDFPHLKAARTAFAALVERYEKSVLSSAKKKLQTNQKKQLAWWRARFEGLSLAEITADKIADARDALSAEKFSRGKERKDKHGKPVAPTKYSRANATTNKYLRTLSRVLNLAVREWRLIDRNPVGDISKKKEPRGRTRFLSDAERERLLKACGETEWPVLRTLVLLALTTGARRGELIGLKWADIDLRAGRAHVRESKNNEQRMLPLAGRGLEALRELKLRGSARSEHVFAQPSEHPGPYVHFDAHWRAALKAAGVADMRFHDLRHTCASMLAAQGASLLEIADVLGHKTLAMVKRYSHLVSSHKEKVIERLVKEKKL